MITAIAARIKASIAGSLAALIGFGEPQPRLQPVPVRVRR